MAKSTSSGAPLISKGRLLVLIFVLLLLYVIVPRLGSFGDSFAVLRDAKVGLVLLATMFLMLTFVVAGSIYWLLAPRPIRYWRIFTVQAASAFTNRLLPAGVGGPVLLVRYLRQNRFTLPQALATVSANALLGWTAHGTLLFLGLLLARGGTLPQADSLPLKTMGLVVSAVFVVILLLVVLLPDLRNRVSRFWNDTLHSLAAYRRRPERLAAAFGLAAALTLCYVAMFYLSARSLSVELPFLQSFLIFTVGIGAGAAIPLPGGLVGVEAGLAGGMIVYGIDPAYAVAVALLYRLITFWLPLIPAFAAFLFTRRWYFKG
ncbi:MAG TPA: lysylphosphatidylglycerol synthase transmembrane domain-containing protein [Candidatus Saccharimonadales bacterium]